MSKVTEYQKQKAANLEEMRKIRLLTPQEVATLLRVSKKTIYNWAYRSRIPCIKLGRGLLRFDRHAIAEWMSKTTMLKSALAKAT